MLQWRTIGFDLLNFDPGNIISDPSKSIRIGFFHLRDCPTLVDRISATILEDLNWRRKQISKFAPSCIDAIPAPFKLPTELFFPPKDPFDPGPPNLRESPLLRSKKGLSEYLAYLENEAPVLARLFSKKLVFRLPETARKMHTYIVGGSGSGKTELLKVLIYEYARHRGYSTTIVLDPHGDFSEQIAKWKINAGGENLVYVHPKLQSGLTPCINPLEMSRTSDADEVMNMTECLSEVFKEIIASKDASITANMETLLNAVLFVLIRRNGSTLRDLQRFMRDDQNQDLVEYARRSCSIGQKDFFHNSFYDSNFSPTKRALYTKIQSLFNSQTFYNLTVGKSTIDLRKIMDSRKLVVFNLSKGIIGKQTAPAFGRFLMGLFQGLAFQRQDTPEKDRVPTHIFIDEFQTFVSPSIETVLDETRKYALHLTFAQQYYGQKTNTQLKGAIMSNTAVKICGSAEGRSLSELSGMMTGVDREDLQYCGLGEFFIKVKDVRKKYSLQQTYGLNVGRRFFAPTFLLGESKEKSMDADTWRKTCEYQLKHYYREAPKDYDSVRAAEVETGGTDSPDPEEISASRDAAPSKRKKNAPLKPPLEL
jgi:hypothetical protein